MRIAVLDTNVNIELPIFQDKMLHIVHQNSYNYQTVSHGTNICKQIFDMCPKASVDVYPIFNEGEIDPEQIIKTLSYILDFCPVYDIINMSFGFEDSTYLGEIRELCDNLSSKGSILVAAHDNWGGMTYPACLDSVIGVDVSDRIKRSDELIYIDGQCVNIICSARQLATYNELGENILSCSTSIHTARITGLIARHFLNAKEFAKEDVKRFLKKRAGKLIIYEQEILPSVNRSFGRCILFPWNKEIATLYKLKKYFYGEIVGVYDFHFSPNIGKQIVSYSNDVCNILDIRNACLADFDTVVIGHLDRFEEKLIHNEIKPFLRRCQIEKKCIYLFDDQLIDMDVVDLLAENIIVPQITNKHVPFTQFGKMWNVPIPVVVVVGTSPHQGKFSLQVKLKAQLELKQYEIGFLATEPSGFLFGAQYVFPYGYRSQVFCDLSKYQVVLNEMAYEMSNKNCELLISGLQSGIVPINNQNAEQDTFIQHSMIFGLNPDAIIVCISYEDDLSLILKVVNTCRILYETKVLALVVYPEARYISSNEKILFEKIDIGSTEYIEWKKTVSKHSGVEVFDMDEIGTKLIADRIVEFFASNNG